MIFDSQEWDWSRAYERQRFGGVDNTIEIGDRKNICIYTNIPAGFIRYLRDVHGCTTCDDLQDIQLYLDDDEKFYVFGYMLNEIDNIDLWRYPRKKLPSWINYRIKDDDD